MEDLDDSPSLKAEKKHNPEPNNNIPHAPVNNNNYNDLKYPSQDLMTP